MEFLSFGVAWLSVIYWVLGLIQGNPRDILLSNLMEFKFIPITAFLVIVTLGKHHVSLRTLFLR